MSGVLHGFVTIGAIIATGFVLAQLKVLDSAAQKLLGQLSFFVAGPALLFTTVADADVRDLLSRNLVATVGAVLTVAVAYLVVARLLRRNLGESVIGVLCTGYVNSANLGIPIAAYVLGNAALVAPILLLQLLVLQPLALAVLDADEAPRSASLLAVVRRTASNPISLMTLAGLVVALTHAHVPAMVDDPLRLLGGMSIPGMLLAFGVSLRLDPLPQRGPDTQELGAIVGLKLVGQPLAAYLIGRVLGLSHDGLLDVTVLAALPTAQNIFVLAMRYDRRVTLARDAIFLSTVLSVPVIFVVAALLT